MSIFIRVLGALLLGGSGYRAYLFVQQTRDFWPSGRTFRRGLDALVASAQPLILTGAFILAGVGLALLVVFARRSADGGKPKFRFDPWAKFFAAIALLGGLMSTAAFSTWIYGLWRGNRFDDLLRSSDAVKTIAQAGFELGMGVALLALAFLVLSAPRSGRAARVRSAEPAPPPIVRRVT